MNDDLTVGEVKARLRLAFQRLKVDLAPKGVSSCCEAALYWSGMNVDKATCGNCHRLS